MADERAESGAPARASRLRALSPRGVLLCGVAVLSGLTVFSRVVPALPVVFPSSGEVRLLGVDAYFHLRQSRFTLHHFPHIQRWDPGTRYPHGNQAIHAGLFDVGIAAVALALEGGVANEGRIAQVAAWAPPILAGLSVFALFLLARAVSGRAAALAACAVLTLYPGELLERSTLGFADHHAAEVGLGLLSVWGLVRVLQLSTRSPAPDWWRPALLHAAPLAAFLFTWAGAPLYLLLLGLAIGLVGVLTVATGRDMSPLAAGAARFGLGLLILVGSASLLWPDLIMVQRLFPWVLVAIALVAVLPGAGALLSRCMQRRGLSPRATALMLVGSVVGLAFLAVWAELATTGYSTMLLKPKSALIAEHGAVTWPTFWKRLGPAGFLALLAIPMAVRGAWRRPAAVPRLVAVAVGGLVIGFWAVTRDHGYAVPAFSALLAVTALDQLAASVSALQKRGRRSAAVAVVAVLFVVPIWPLEAASLPWLREEGVRAQLFVDEGWLQTLRFLEEETPAPTLAPFARVPHRWKEGFDYPEGTYGVLAPWDVGHAVAAVGRRHPVASHSTSPSTARFLLATSEGEALELLDTGCKGPEHVRYVVLDARTLGQLFPGKVLAAGRDAAELSAVPVAHEVDGQALTLPELGAVYGESMAALLFVGEAATLGRFRLVYRSPQLSFLGYVASDLVRGRDGRVKSARRWQRQALPLGTPELQRAYSELARAGAATIGDKIFYGGALTPSVKVFERVKGARLMGRARPGALVLARLQLRSRMDGRVIGYRRSVRADGAGSFEVVVACSTEEEPPHAVPLSLYSIQQEGADPVSVRVREEDVLRGVPIHVGMLPAARRSP